MWQDLECLGLLLDAPTKVPVRARSWFKFRLETHLSNVSAWFVVGLGGPLAFDVLVPFVT